VELVESESVQEHDRFILAQLWCLGLEKGESFKPDERQKSLLSEAAVVGEAMAKANTSEKRVEPAFWPNTYWKHAAVREELGSDAAGEKLFSVFPILRSDQGSLRQELDTQRRCKGAVHVVTTV
jgi:hypothetical protein